MAHRARIEPDEQCSARGLAAWQKLPSRRFHDLTPYNFDVGRFSSDQTDAGPRRALDALARARIVRRAMLSRGVETRLLELFSEGRLFGTIHTCIGQELVGAVLAEFLREGDTLFSTHRCHGHFLSLTDDVDGLVAELMGRATGVCGGVGGSQHLHAPGFYSSGIQGGIFPASAGVAFAARLAGGDRMAVAIAGDGTLGEGALYETMNLAALWDLPLLIVLEDNGYAQLTPKVQGVAGDILARAGAFGISTWRADTWDWPALRSQMDAAFTHVRTTRTPAFLLVDTYRLRAHSKGDDLRSPAEIAEYERRDVLNLLLDDRDPDALAGRDAAADRIRVAVERAEAAPFPTPVPAPAAAQPVGWTRVALPAVRGVAAINGALARALEHDPRVLVIGEDIEDPYGGAFKVTQGLSSAFPDRVRNTPISEAAIVGLSAGLALSGHRPVVEIMFGDFSALAFDQIVNHAAKFQAMYALAEPVDLIVRTPMGGGRGYGPTHSQSLERHFFGTPGLRVVAVSALVDPGDVYAVLLQGGYGPTFVVEHKRLYGAMLQSRAPDGFDLLHSVEPLPAAWLRPRTNHIDVTLIGYGGMGDRLVDAADRLFEEHDLICQVLCPTQIYPLDMRAYAHVIGQAPAVVVAEEGQGFAGFGAEVSAQAADSVSSNRRPDCPRRGGADHRARKRRARTPGAARCRCRRPRRGRSVQMSATPITIPRVNANDDSVELLAWLVEDGDFARAGQTIAELGTTKATVTLESPGEGFVLHREPKGAVIAVGAPVADLLATREELDTARRARQSASAAAGPSDVGQPEAVRFSARARAHLAAQAIDPAAVSLSGLITTRRLIDLSRGRRVPLDWIKRAEVHALVNAADVLASSVTVQVGRHRLGPAAGLPTIVFHAARLLSAYPQLNAAFDRDAVVEYTHVDLGVALDLGRGLRVVTMPGAEARSIAEIRAVARRLHDALPRGSTAPGGHAAGDVHGDRPVRVGRERRRATHRRAAVSHPGCHWRKRPRRHAAHVDARLRSPRLERPDGRDVPDGFARRRRFRDRRARGRRAGRPRPARSAGQLRPLRHRSYGLLRALSARRHHAGVGASGRIAGQPVSRVCRGPFLNGRVTRWTKWQQSWRGFRASRPTASVRRPAWATSASDRQLRLACSGRGCARSWGSTSATTSPGRRAWPS